MKARSSYFLGLSLTWLILTALVFTPDSPVALAQSADTPSTGNPVAPQLNFFVYLPMISGGTGVVNGSNDAGKLWLPYTLTDSSVLPTYGVSIAVDPIGGNHAAYAIYSGTNEQGLKPATYAYCANQCADKNNWASVSLGENVQDVRLALDPNGRPRLMLFGPIYDPDWPRMRYQYAACNNACTNLANWTITTIATPIEAVATREYNNNRYFAMDKQGRPAFIYTDTNQNNHPGTFYLTCQTNCTDINNWTETALFPISILDKPSLAFSASGQPRLAFGYYDGDSNLNLAYAQCDTNCTNGANWSGMVLVQIHGTAKFSLQVDAAGNPRIGFYSGSYAYTPFAAMKLYYLWCNSGCAADAGNWFFNDTGMPSGSGDGVDLALDKQNRPRLSFELSTQGLGFAWCNTNCESGTPTWQSLEVETKQELSQNFEVLPVQRCTISTWFNGQRTSLALDPAGNPRFGYDAQHWWYGTELVNGVPKPCNYQDATVARYALVKQP